MMFVGSGGTILRRCACAWRTEWLSAGDVVRLHQCNIRMGKAHLVLHWPISDKKCSIVRGAHIKIPYYAPSYRGTPQGYHIEGFFLSLPIFLPSLVLP